jgi:hypothetical protein
MRLALHRGYACSLLYSWRVNMDHPRELRETAAEANSTVVISLRGRQVAITAPDPDGLLTPSSGRVHMLDAGVETFGCRVLGEPEDMSTSGSYRESQPATTRTKRSTSDTSLS